MISECIYDDLPPKMKILNKIIPILMHFCSLVLNWSIASCIKLRVIQQNDVINDVKLFSTVYCRIYCHTFFEVIQSNVMLQKQVHFKNNLKLKENIYLDMC